MQTRHGDITILSGGRQESLPVGLPGMQASLLCRLLYVYGESGRGAVKNAVREMPDTSTTLQGMDLASRHSSGTSEWQDDRVALLASMGSEIAQPFPVPVITTKTLTRVLPFLKKLTCRTAVTGKIQPC